MDIVTVNIGKKGLTENVIKEINLMLEKHGIVKVRLLRNFREFTSGGSNRKDLAFEIAKHVNGKLIDLRGFVLTFKR
jgi:RNA-binding protein